MEKSLFRSEDYNFFFVFFAANFVPGYGNIIQNVL